MVVARHDKVGISIADLSGTFPSIDGFGWGSWVGIASGNAIKPANAAMA
jgi:hypothetical protein